MGYDLSLTRAPIEPIGAVLAAMRKKGYTIIHTREGHRPDLADLPRQQALALEADWRGDRRPGPLRPDPRSRRSRVGKSFRSWLRVQANRSSTSPARARSMPPTCELVLQQSGIENLILTGITTDVCVHTTMREANDRGYECLVARGLLRRHRSRQPSRGPEDDHHARWCLRRRSLPRKLSWRFCHDTVDSRSPSTSAGIGGTHPVQPGGLRSIEARNISKRFGSLQALTDVSMKLRPGSFRALLGENGAGKSTLVKCIMGTYRADTGSVRVGTQRCGAEKSPAGARSGHRHGLPALHAGREHDRRRKHGDGAASTCRRSSTGRRRPKSSKTSWRRCPSGSIPRSCVRNLSAGEKQKVEILKQLYLRRKVLILDEPTSVLTPDEADEVLGMVRGMCDQG